jgi:DNA-binding transcriptional ArsR family regulator
MPQRTADLGRVFHALADPTRLAVVERLGRGPVATSELARPFDMALPSFIQHLEVLEKAGLVASTKAGRVRTFRLTPEPLEAAEDWMSAQRRLWERRLDQFDEYVRTLKETDQ